MYCSGGHGLSIGSIGGKVGSTNTVTNVLFSDSTVISSTNGVRIKTNYDTTGSVDNVTYSNIKLKDITEYGMDIQQDYLNGGPTGKPTNGVRPGLRSSHQFLLSSLCSTLACFSISIANMYKGKNHKHPLQGRGRYGNSERNQLLHPMR